MLTKKKPIDIELNYPLDEKYGSDNIVFFDIETTGFSPKTTYLYLIGCIYYKDSAFHLIQWFAEDISEETLLISCFFEFIRDYDILVTITD